MWKQRIMSLALAVIVATGGVFTALAQEQPADGETQAAVIDLVVGCPRVSVMRGRPVMRGFLLESGARLRDLLPALRGGQSVEEAIEAAGGDADEAVEAMLDAAAERLNAAVENGRLTRERADALLEQLEARLDRALGTALPERHITVCVGRGVIDVTADLTGLTRQEVRRQLRNGATLPEILEAHGSSAGALIDRLAASAEARLNVLVVDGHITQEQADEYLARLRAELAERLASPAADADDVI